jgi:hypothetical protein
MSKTHLTKDIGPSNLGNPATQESSRIQSANKPSKAVLYREARFLLFRSNHLRFRLMGRIPPYRRGLSLLKNKPKQKSASFGSDALPENDDGEIVWVGEQRDVQKIEGNRQKNHSNHDQGSHQQSRERKRQEKIRIAHAKITTVPPSLTIHDIASILRQENAVEWAPSATSLLRLRDQPIYLTQQWILELLGKARNESDKNTLVQIKQDLINASALLQEKTAQDSNGATSRNSTNAVRDFNLLAAPLLLSIRKPRYPEQRKQSIATTQNLANMMLWMYRKTQNSST